MHLEIIGRSRYGKSTFLEHQILNAPGGFVFLDPVCTENLSSGVVVVKSAKDGA
jgi:hypothetical protein